MNAMGLSLLASPIRSELSDAELVARAIAGEAWAEGVIYRRHATAVSNLAGRLLRSRADAEDVLHDVFLEALDELSSLRDRSALKPWLLQRTVRQVQRRFRRRRWWGLLGKHASEELTLEALAKPSCPPDVRLEVKDLDRLLANLPERQRIAWLLARVEGEPLATIAIACNVSLATAKRDLVAAQAALEAPQQETP